MLTKDGYLWFVFNNKTIPPKVTLFLNVIEHLSYSPYLATRAFSPLPLATKSLQTENIQAKIYLYECWLILHAFFSKSTFQKIISRIPSECQTVWIQFRLDILLVLICIQTVCKSNQQTPLVY